MNIRKSDYTHVGGRRENEDAYRCEILDNNRAYAVVCDGVGGHGEGRRAAQVAVKHLSNARRCNLLPTREQILGWMRDANREMEVLRGDVLRMKTTAVFLAVQDAKAIWAHIGDSRLYHFHNGDLVDYTKDHSVPQIQVIAGEITREQIPFSPDRNRVLRVLGNEELNPEITEQKQLQPGMHAFLLCTDGFWEYLQDSEIWLDLRKSRTPDQWLMYLRARGDERKQGISDNNTAVAMFIEI